MDLAFEDGGTERNFWGRLQGWTVEIVTAAGGAQDVVVEGCSNAPDGWLLVSFRLWDDEESGPVGDPFEYRVDAITALTIY